jgi:hypothetical protein
MKFANVVLIAESRPRYKRASAEGGNRTHTPLAGPRILRLPDCKSVALDETPASRIPEEHRVNARQRIAGNLVAALAQC